MRIFYLATQIYPMAGGIQQYNHNFCNGLGKIYGKANIFVITQNLQKYDESSNYTVIKFPVVKLELLQRILNRTKILSGLVTVLLQKKIDLLVCGHINLACWGYYLEKILKIRYIVITHGIEIWGNLERKKFAALRNAGGIITVSEYTERKLVEKGIEEQKIYIVRNGVNTEIFSPGDKNDEMIKKYSLHNKKVLLTVGRLEASERYKGQDMVIRAMPEIIKSIANVVYLIVGDGSDKERLEKLSSELSVRDNVIFVGSVNNKEMPQYYNCCDVFIMPSRVEYKNGKWAGEGFGIVYLEANACSKPVIGGRAGGAIEAIENEKTGFLVNPTDSREIATAIIRLLKDNQLAKRLGENGRRRIIEKFNEKDLYRQIEITLKEILT